MRRIIGECQPITGRGVGYKLFAAGLIPSMSTKDMQRVCRLLKEARERGMVPWKWIVDETRGIERRPSWSDPEQYTECVIRGYRRDYWDLQPARVEVWSEKGTVRGVLSPVLNRYGVGFRVHHGFTGATEAHDIAIDDDGRELIALYCGDYDPSGMCMSEHDLPARLEKYGGHHVDLRRIALTPDDCDGIGPAASFRASEKRKDPRYGWFTSRFGDRCWELDAMDPNDLRSRVEEAIIAEIEREAWDRCQTVEKAERESLQSVMEKWGEARDGAVPDPMASGD
jgi:hypothetical protein